MPWIMDHSVEGGRLKWVDEVPNGEGAPTVTYGNNPAGVVGTAQEGGFVPDARWDRDARPPPEFAGLLPRGAANTKPFSPHALLADQVFDQQLQALVRKGAKGMPNRRKNPAGFLRFAQQHGVDLQREWDDLRKRWSIGKHLPPAWEEASKLAAISLPDG